MTSWKKTVSRNPSFSRGTLNIPTEIVWCGTREAEFSRSQARVCLTHLSNDKGSAVHNVGEKAINEMKGKFMIPLPITTPSSRQWFTCCNWDFSVYVDTSWCTAMSHHPSVSAACWAWSCCGQWIFCRWGKRCRGSRCCWPAGYSEVASPWGPWIANVRLSSFDGKIRRWCTPGRQTAMSFIGALVGVGRWWVNLKNQERCPGSCEEGDQWLYELP